MSRYNAEFPFAVAFPPQAMTNVLAEWLAKEGATQAHIAGEYHFPFFFLLLHFIVSWSLQFRNRKVRACYVLL